MFWSGTRAVRSSLLVGMLLASCLTVSSPALAGGRGAERRQRAEGKEESAERVKAPPQAKADRAEKERSSVNEAATRVEVRGGPTVRPEPVVRARPEPVARARFEQPERSYSPAPYGQGTRPTPVSERPDSRVSPRAADRGWRGDRGGEREGATPYRLYTPPNERQTPADPKQVRRPDPVTAPGYERNVKPERPAATTDRQRVQPWAPPERGRDGTLEASPALERDRERERARDRDSNPRAVEPPLARSGERVLKVPEARFRGQEAERNVRAVRQEDQKRLQEQLWTRLKDQNRRKDGYDGKLPSHDAVGNAISGNVSLVLRDGSSRLSVGYGHIQGSFGSPKYHYLVAPRGRADYWDGYWDGYTDGYWAGKHRWHGKHVVVSYYYGYYWSDPYWFAFYYPGYYPAVYHYWGWGPGWVHPSRTYYAPVEYVYVPTTPYRYYTGSSVDGTAANRTIEDVRRAWFDSEISNLAYHLTDQVDIRIYFDGEYEYSTTTEDYYAMTVDAMATTYTVAMDFDRPIWLSTHEFFVTGRHVFYDPNDVRQVVYVSYRFRNLGGEWFLVAVGSSLEPIQHQYRDFRY